LVEEVISDDDGFEEVLDEDGAVKVDEFGVFHGFQLVGHGKVASENCGTYRSTMGCLNREGHDFVSLDGKDYRGKGFFRPFHVWCGRPSCPTCFKHGWAVRLAKNGEARLLVFAKKHGQIEHVVVSVPPADYGMEYNAMRAKVLKVLESRGIVGGCIVFHGVRYNSRAEALRKAVSAGWYWSPHFHVLGFLLDGYGHCRNCKYKGLDCMRCSGFEGRVRHLRENDGYIVKVLGKRKTIFGSLWYEANHATVRAGVTRFHVLTWFGVCSYRNLNEDMRESVRLRLLAEKEKGCSCPICGKLLVRVWHVGVRRIVTVFGAKGFVPSFLDDLVDDEGRENWVEAPSGDYRSFS
jgi:hypothetical protein